MSSITERLTTVRQNVHEACLAAGRSPSSVQLIAVSKRHPLQSVEEVLRAQQVHLGESYAQELRDKAAQVSSPLVRWHFIGRVQRNKARYIAPVAHRVHAIEHVEQAAALASRAPQPLKMLMAVNVGREESKSGVLPEQALERAKQLSMIQGVELVGLMTLPPVVADPQDASPFFEELAHLARQGRAAGLPLHELSMGMSHDYAVAIRHGATWIRVGTAIFGPRHEQLSGRGRLSRVKGS